MNECGVKSIVGKGEELFILPFKPGELTFFEPVVAGVFAFVEGVFMGIEEP